MTRFMTTLPIFKLDILRNLLKEFTLSFKYIETEREIYSKGKLFASMVVKLKFVLTLL